MTITNNTTEKQERLLDIIKANRNFGECALLDDVQVAALRYSDLFGSLQSVDSVIGHLHQRDAITLYHEGEVTLIKIGRDIEGSN
jgi:hypothetical protein